MTVGSYTESFFGKPVRDFRSGDKISDRNAVYRLSQDYDSEESQQALLNEFLTQIPVGEIEALVIGPWADSPEKSPQGYLDALIERRSEFSALRALFVGDMTFEDCEISWIIQGDYSKLLEAFPDLLVLRIRGGEKLRLPPFNHPRLRELAIETGGLSSAIVDAIAGSNLPELRRLELWLGDENYGFDGTLTTYQNLLMKVAPERLEYLGLRNASISDALAVYISKQPWLCRLHTLDLSMGTLGDEGAQALLDSPYLEGVRVLDLRHHYISDKLVAKLKSLPLQLIIDEAEEEDDGDRYVQVSE